jgi:parvulin-like peptidyl-prolyl isomerase
MTLKIPAGWHILEQKEREQLFKEGLNLFTDNDTIRRAFSRVGEDSTNNYLAISKNPVINIQLENTALLLLVQTPKNFGRLSSEIKSGYDYLLMLQALNKKLNLLKLGYGSIAECIISGATFYTLPCTTKTMGLTSFSEVYCARIKDEYVFLNAVSSSAFELGEVRKIITTIEIKPFQQDSATLLLNHARILISAAKFKEAVDCCAKALKMKPDLSELNYARGIAYSGLTQYENAEKDLGIFLKYNPENTSGLLAMSSTKYYLHKNDEALQYINKVLARNNASIPAYQLKMSIFIASDQLDSALEVVNLMLKKNSDDVSNYLNKIELLFVKGDTKSTIGMIDSLQPVLYDPTQKSICLFYKYTTYIVLNKDVTMVKSEFESILSKPILPIWSFSVFDKWLSAMTDKNKHDKITAITDEFKKHVESNPANLDSLRHYKAETRKPQGIRLSMITVKDKETATAISNKLKRGADFSRIADEFAGNREKSSGGDIGYVSEKDMVPEIRDAAVNLKAGLFSEPIKVNSVFVIIKRTE